MISSVRFKMMLLVVIVAISCSAQNQPANNSGKIKSVLTIKAAGYIEGQKPEGVDAITEATSVGRNIHVISDALQKELKLLGVESEVVLFNDTDRIQEVLRGSAIGLIIFAGPAYSSQFPSQLKNVVPNLKDTILQRKIVCTSMTTCRFMDSGQRTVVSFNSALKDLGISTIDGLVIHHGYEDKEWKSKVKGFAEELQKTLKIQE